MFRPIPKIISSETRFEASRASGPGGQNVNKRSSKVTGLWNFSVSRQISQDQKNKIAEVLKNRVSMGRTLIVSSQRHKLQAQNKKAVLEIMSGLVSKALEEKKRRVPTKPTAASKIRILESKKKRASTKKLRTNIF